MTILSDFSHFSSFSNPSFGLVYLPLTNFCLSLAFKAIIINLLTLEVVVSIQLYACQNHSEGINVVKLHLILL